MTAALQYASMTGPERLPFSVQQLADADQETRERRDILQVAVQELVHYHRIDDLAQPQIPDASIRFAIWWLTDRVKERVPSAVHDLVNDVCREFILRHIDGVRALNRRGD